MVPSDQHMTTKVEKMHKNNFSKLEAVLHPPINWSAPVPIVPLALLFREVTDGDLFATVLALPSTGSTDGTIVYCRQVGGRRDGGVRWPSSKPKISEKDAEAVVGTFGAAIFGRTTRSTLFAWTFSIFVSGKRIF